MERFDLTTSVKKQKIPADTILVLQGSEEKAVTMLHSGMAELLSAGEGVDAKTPEEIISGSARVGLIKGESVCGILGLRNSVPHPLSIRTMTDCLVSNTPVEVEKFIGILQSNLAFNLQVLRALVQRIESSVFLFKNYKYLWHKFASIADSIALADDFGPELLDIEQAARSTSSLPEYSAYLRHRLVSAERQPPPAWDHNLFLGRIQDSLSLYETQDSITIESIIDNQQFMFLKRILRKQNEILTALFNKDEPTNFYVFQFLGRTLEQMLSRNAALVLEITRLMEILYGENGWIQTTLDSQPPDDRQTKVYNYYLSMFSWRCRKDAINLLGTDLSKEFPLYTNLKQYEKLDIPELDQTGEVQPNESNGKPAITVQGNRLDKYNNLMRRILEFSEIDQEKQRALITKMNAFKNMENKFESKGEVNDLKADIANLYWELYEECFLKIIDTDLKGFVPGIMLHFGLLDETLIPKEDLLFIDEAYTKSLIVDQTIPVMTLPYFLEKIYKAEVQPSITEMGEPFNKVLKNQERMTKKETAEAYLFQDTAEDTVRYELRGIVKDTIGLLFGSKKRAFPILCKEALVGTMERVFQEPESLAEQIDVFRSRDFSMFYREVVLHHKFGTDIIRKEIVPNFVLYPTAGSRMMMWQELDGAKRDTPGRIFLPLCFNEKLDDALLTVISQFRWELQKTMAGAKWMDPVEGGLAGAYYDYITFFKKNTKLSPEAKEKIRALIRKTRSDRDRFTSDYTDWVMHEYEGKIRLNPVAREILYRYCPFDAEKREELGKKGLYADLEMKGRNRTRRDVLKMETRLKRFEREGIAVPEDMRLYFDFLQK